MKVRELIERLAEVDQEAEVHVPFPQGFFDTIEADEVTESTATYGILLPTPRTVPTVILHSAAWGL